MGSERFCNLLCLSELRNTSTNRDIFVNLKGLLSSNNSGHDYLGCWESRREVMKKLGIVLGVCVLSSVLALGDVEARGHRRGGNGGRR